MPHKYDDEERTYASNAVQTSHVLLQSRLNSANVKIQLET